MNKLTTIIVAGAALLFPVLTHGQAVVTGSDFEAEQFPPAGWSVVDNDGDGNGWTRYQNTDIYVTQYAPGKACAISFAKNHLDYSNLGAQDNWLITEPFLVSNEYTLLSLIYAAQDLDSVEPIEILVSENEAGDLSSFSQLYKTTADNGYDDDINFYEMERSLAQYAGKRIRLAVRHQSHGSYALTVDNLFVYNMAGAKLPTGLTVTPSNGGGLKATISWNTPAQAANGSPLQEVDILIYRDGELAATVAGNPGETESWTDENLTIGTHSYALAASTSEGITRRTSARSAFIGPDVPKEVGDPIAMARDGKIHISWNPPTKGATNGYIDPAAITYMVYRVIDGQSQVIAEGLTEPSFVDENPIPNKSMIYAIVACNEAGNSRIADYTAAIVTDGVEFAAGITSDRNNSLGRLPIDINSEHSVSQTIYYPEDFNFSKGEINGIIYKGYKGNDSALEYPVKIYMHETDATDLGNGWDTANLSDESLVFDSTLKWEQGARDYMLTFPESYDYQGGNLVVTFVKAGRPNGSYADRFYSTSVDTPNRSYTGSVYDPVNINALPSLSSWSEKKLAEIPSTRFLMTPKGIASIEGQVVNSADNTPIEGCRLEIEAYNMVAITDAEGNYSFPYVPLDVTSFSATRAGFEPKNVEVTLAEGVTARYPVSLVQLPFASLSGHIVAGDTGLPAAGARVSASGYDEVQAIADEDGNFVLSPLYLNQAYTVKSAYPLYGSYEIEYTPTENTDLGAILLERALIPPFAVETEVAADGSSVALNWKNPLERNVVAGWQNMNRNGDTIVTGDAGDKWYSPQDFNAGHAYTAATVAARKLAGSVVSDMRVYIKASEGAFIAKVWEGNRENAAAIASQTIPAEKISANGEWVEIHFDEPAEIREGRDYIVGVQCLNASEAPLGEVKDYIAGDNNILWADNGLIYWNSYNGYAMEANFSVQGTSEPVIANPDAPECEYRVYRREAAANEWTPVTSAPLKETNFIDNGWASLMSGDWTYGVTAIYQGGESDMARSLVMNRSNDIDAGVIEILSPSKSVELQNDAEIIVRITNFGEIPASDIPVIAELNGAQVASSVCTETLNKGESTVVSLGTIQLSEGVHNLRVSTLLENDMVAANDGAELVLPNMANIHLTGYRWNAYGNAGFMSIQSNNAEAAVFNREITPSDALITCGEYLDGVIYGYAATWYGQPRCFVAVKPDVWSLEMNLENTDDYCLDMAYDYNSKQMYGLKAEGEVVKLAIIDLATGSMNVVANIDCAPHAMTCSTDGTLYLVDSDGYLRTLNPETGITSIVGSTETSGNVSYLQSMAYDHNTGRIFWAHEGNIASGELNELDAETGKATLLGNICYMGKEACEIVALHVPYSDTNGISAPESRDLKLSVNPDGTVNVYTASEGRLNVYSLSGEIVMQRALLAGESRVVVDAEPGIYLMELINKSGRLAQKTPLSK